MSFSSIEKLLSFKGDVQFNSVIASISCTVIKTQLDSSNEIGPLVEFVNSIEIQMKHLVIQTPIIQNYTVLQDQVMNYNAIIYHDGWTIIKSFLISKHFT